MPSCDLVNCYKENKGYNLISILVAPLYKLTDIISNKHIDNIGIIPTANIPNQFKSEKNKLSNKNSSEYIDFVKNGNYRYHYIDEKVLGYEMVIDFKHYFTISTKILHKYQHDKIAYDNLQQLEREQISSRFAII